MSTLCLSGLYGIEPFNFGNMMVLFNTKLTHHLGFWLSSSQAQGGQAERLQPGLSRRDLATTPSKGGLEWDHALPDGQPWFYGCHWLPLVAMTFEVSFSGETCGSSLGKMLDLQPWIHLDGSDMMKHDETNGAW